MNFFKNIFKKTKSEEIELERKVYPDWAMKGFEQEKQIINYSIFNELLENNKIHIQHNKDIEYNQEKYKDFDIVIQKDGIYCRSICTIFKNKNNLSDDELALICDGGNLCFGYLNKGEVDGVKTFCIFED